MSLDGCIVKKCEDSWDEEFISGVRNKNNCSGFVKSVAGKLSVQLPSMQADGIIDAIGNSWKKVNTGAEAAQKAGAGFFVVAGLKAKDHSRKVIQGHVVVVVSGPLYRAKYPLCWGGSTGTAQSRGDKSVGEVWNTTDRDNVSYYVYKHQVCAA